MKRSEAARYARWSAVAALLLAIVTAGVYLKHGWMAWLEKKKAPPPVPVNVERQSNGLTFSKLEGERKVFTLEASKSTEFKNEDASLLEEVQITIFGKTGQRHDTIHTRSCQYAKASGRIECHGDVKIVLESAAEAEHHTQGKLPQAVHVETRAVTFERGSGVAQTDQPVKFQFPAGSGEAVGLEYNSTEGTLKLLRDVKFTLVQPRSSKVNREQNPALQADNDVHVKGTSLDFVRDTRTMHLAGQVEAATGTTHLSSGEITLELNTEFRAQKIFAAPGTRGTRPALTSGSVRGPLEMNADRLTAWFAPEGWVTKMEAKGKVRGSHRTGSASSLELDEFRAEHASLDLWPRTSQPKLLNLNGDVVLKATADKGIDSRMLQTSALRMEFAAGGEGSGAKPKRAETLAAGTIEWTDAAPQSPAAGSLLPGAPTRTKLQADKLAMDFGPLGKAKQLTASGNVLTTRAVSGKPEQFAAARTGVAQLLARGGWSQMDLQGDVKLKEGVRSAQAERAVFVRAAQTATLTGRAMVRDAATETRAARIIFVQLTGEVRAEGAVRSTEFSTKGGAVRFAPTAATITSDTMQGNAKSGLALYTGHARLWQGDAVLEADSIELLQEAKILNAAGNVRAIFPQIASETPTNSLRAQNIRKKSNLWRVAADALTYRDLENRAHLERNVVVQSAQQGMKAPSLDLYFTRAKAAAPGTAGTHSANVADVANASEGAQQISRAVATGGVVVEEGNRKATAERAEYSAAEGKFVMSGGNPTLFDGKEGTTTGRQLTFFLADDTIIVDSGKGSRTLTKHRVEK
ncbi:MAG TPA: LPS export ABC transporter periplasmic protein LptC [Candidatus Dormibacteraeota bacterium]|nr:LPS export ABC transporter periplasmic protein LptC [Candidatus Dormibacteraeota bacterium]